MYIISNMLGALKQALCATQLCPYTSLIKLTSNSSPGGSFTASIIFPLPRVASIWRFNCKPWSRGWSSSGIVSAAAWLFWFFRQCVSFHSSPLHVQAGTCLASSEGLGPESLGIPACHKQEVSPSSLQLCAAIRVLKKAIQLCFDRPHPLSPLTSFQG